MAMLNNQMVYDTNLDKIYRIYIYMYYRYVMMIFN